MVGPGRSWQPRALGPRCPQEFAAEAQRAGAADTLKSDNVARERSEGEFGEKRREVLVSFLADVGFGCLRREQLLLCLFDRPHDRRIAAVVAVDTDAEIELVRVRIRTKRADERQQWIGGKRSQVGSTFTQTPKANVR